jgi:hypothetical protein
MKMPQTILTFAVPFIALLMLGACQSTPQHTALELPPESLANRQMQTRRFDGIDETDLLAACAGVMQDLGFNLDESEAPLGVIVASKQRPAGQPAKATIAWFLDLLTDIELEFDRDQRIRASIVTRPAADKQRSYLVRVTFQRIVWNTKNEVSKREVLNEPELHQIFFENLSKSVFLEAHSI